jgi:hypothetical protein
MFVFEQPIKSEYRSLSVGSMLVLDDSAFSGRVATVTSMDGMSFTGAFDDKQIFTAEPVDQYNGRVIGWSVCVGNTKPIYVYHIRRASGEELFIHEGKIVSFTAAPIISKINLGTSIELLGTKKTARLVHVTDQGMVFELSSGNVGVLDVADPRYINCPAINRKYIPVFNIVKVESDVL